MNKVYRLGSSWMFNAPGVLRWAIEGYKIPDQQDGMVKIFENGYGLPAEVARGLLSGQIPHRVDGEVVIVGGEGND